MVMDSIVMKPAGGERVLRYVGDRISFTLTSQGSAEQPSPARGWKAFLRTNLGRAARRRHEIIHAHTGKLGLAASSWRDIPMTWTGEGWELDLALTEVGFFKAKAYVTDSQNRQHWTHGSDFVMTVHPDQYRTSNTIYCAFTRMFGPSRTQKITRDPARESVMSALDKQGFTVIPPSGTFRDLIKQLPHIVDTLGCRILHLLPVNPVPTTYARFGRFGSPYACQDLLNIDPALVEFDKRATGIDQFRELTYATHLRGGRVFLDAVINHTGWGSTLQENHPEWFVRTKEGKFVCPGAWGVTWEDLAEMHHENPELWEYMGDVFLEWCRRGVDGFRCDAGYKIPVPAWQYITARVQDEFPETVFLLEGLGGPWAATEDLLTEGGMQWAYSELFQNFKGQEIASYLDYCLRQSEQVGLYVHYSETHDNERLAEKGRDWSLLRNRLCALMSVGGGFGFTCGVEWLAAEKINVHQSRGLSWDNPDNLIPELAQLNRLLAEHPCFFDSATLARLSGSDTPVCALSRISAEELDRLLILVNTDSEADQTFVISKDAYAELGQPDLDLLTSEKIQPSETHPNHHVFNLKPGESRCLAVTESPKGLWGEPYRLARAQSAWALQAVSHFLECEFIGPCPWRELSVEVSQDPGGFLAALGHLDKETAAQDLIKAIQEAREKDPYPNVTVWQNVDARRITPVPPGHWLLIEQSAPFRVTPTPLDDQESGVGSIQSVQFDECHLAVIPPRSYTGDLEICLERFGSERPEIKGKIRYLQEEPDVTSLTMATDAVARGLKRPTSSGLALMTNGRGGMARMQIDLGKVESKYDAVLAANLHASVPVDRHIFVKRIRVWVVADGFITPLNGQNLIGFAPGPPCEWRFVASAGDGRMVEIHCVADMLPGSNTTVLRFLRPQGPPAFGTDLPESSQVSLTVRPDILDRNFHYETQKNERSEHHFSSHVRKLTTGTGFEFKPAQDRCLVVRSRGGEYHEQEEWSLGVLHPIEATRGQVDREDMFSPGWFELPLNHGDQVDLVCSAELNPPDEDQLDAFVSTRQSYVDRALAKAALPDDFGQRLVQAVQAFVVKREESSTVIAGYPWFLDWGRDSLICARGMLTAGLVDEVRQLLVTFGRFAQKGTLPNSIHGEDASNRDTSDAPLWYGVVAEELAAQAGSEIYDIQVDDGGRTIRDVLVEIADGYRVGTSNGIGMDPKSGLIWSPSHFTWMDTNHPPGTPRQGFPIEIQALWIRLCRQLARLGVPETGVGNASWQSLADQAQEFMGKLFWIEELGYPADLLIASSNQPAKEALVDTALRSNCLFTVSLGLLEGSQARRCVDAAGRYLVVPGALRSLAPLPVSVPLAIHGSDGGLLNHPEEPYWGKYEGDEDTRRKPAYHNGTAWTWPFPTFCEALAMAWKEDPQARAAARSYLGSMDRLLAEGCLGHLPEIVDGDTPHTHRGCDAQAWSVTEALRVWKLLQD